MKDPAKSLASLTTPRAPRKSEGFTHEVTNQPPPLVGHDVYGTDTALVEAVRRHDTESSGDGVTRLAELGRLAGSEQAQDWGTQANAHPPSLRTHDRYGSRRPPTTPRTGTRSAGRSPTRR